jgi:3-phenylpropionate/trans-cinnamate dioxygenase ferredoxin reductase component
MLPLPMRNAVVVGTSLAGLRAAEQLRREGYRGALHLVGKEKHFPPYDRPPLSKEVLNGKRHLEEARLRVFEELEAVVIRGRSAVHLDMTSREIHLDDGCSLGYDGLIIATGASVRKIRCEGGDRAGVHYFRTAEDCARVKASLAPGSRAVIVGAGFIGSEVASACRARGLDVTVIDSALLPMAEQIGERTAQYLLDQHRQHGIATYLGVSVASIEGKARAEAVRLTDGSVIAADIVVIGIGVVPETRWLEDSGLVLDDGVLCDEHCTAVGTADVVAAGDIARWLNPLYGTLMRIEHWTNAVEQAEYAAAILANGSQGRPGFSPLPYFWSDQHDMHLQFAGVAGTESFLAEGSLEDRQFIMLHRADGQDVGVIGVNWPSRFGKHRRRLAEQLSVALR